MKCIHGPWLFSVCKFGEILQEVFLLQNQVLAVQTSLIFYSFFFKFIILHCDLY